MNGSEAQRGDIVRNLTTDEIGTVRDYSQFGRVLVQRARAPFGRDRWERSNIEIILENLDSPYRR